VALLNIFLSIICKKIIKKLLFKETVFTFITLIVESTRINRQILQTVPIQFPNLIPISSFVFIASCIDCLEFISSDLI